MYLSMAQENNGCSGHIELRRKQQVRCNLLLVPLELSVIVPEETQSWAERETISAHYQVSTYLTKDRNSWWRCRSYKWHNSDFLYPWYMYLKVEVNMNIQKENLSGSLFSQHMKPGIWFSEVHMVQMNWTIGGGGDEKLKGQLNRCPLSEIHMELILLNWG